MQKVLELNHIGYSYHSLHGEIPALKDVSFCVNKGEFVAIVGASGCGKSTLLSIIAGLLKPETGTVTFYNRENPKQPLKIGYMLQKDYLFEWLTVYKNICLGLELNHQMNPGKLQMIERLLKEYDLYRFKEKRPGELSGGMKQRAALIRTLALEPELLLLDEPFSALDYQTRLIVSGDICRLIKEANKTMIIITHDLSEAISLADKVIVLSRRPAIVKKELPINLTLQDDSLLASRNAPEFREYFNSLWEDLIDEA